MKKILIKTLVFTLIFGFTGCNDWLNVSPKTQMKAEDLFSNETGFRDALIGAYSLMVLPDVYGRDLTCGWLDVLAQYYPNTLTQTPTGEHEYKQAASYNYKYIDEENRIRAVWSNLYATIANVNLALLHIDAKSGVFKSEALHHIYKGELLGLRAMLHFDLLRLFASSAAMDGGNGLSKPAIPYIETYGNIPQPQLTGKEIIEKIKKDLTEAKELMREYEDFSVKISSDPMYNRKFRMNYYAVTALLARVYLWAGEKADALKQAQEVIGKAAADDPDALFALASGPSVTRDPFFLNEIIFRLDVQKLEDNIESFVSMDIVDPAAHNLVISKEGIDNLFVIQGTENDFRKPWFTDYSDGSSQVLTKYKDIKYIPMLKLSEMYLIAAECAGGAQGDMYLNELRNHRGLGVMQDGQQSFDEFLLQEYRREFVGEGQMFFFYKRLAMDRIGVEENVGVADPNKIYNLPIPLSEKDFGNIN